MAGKGERSISELLLRTCNEGRRIAMTTAKVTMNDNQREPQATRESLQEYGESIVTKLADHVRIVDAKLTFSTTNIGASLESIRSEQGRIRVLLRTIDQGVANDYRHETLQTRFDTLENRFDTLHDMMLFMLQTFHKDPSGPELSRVNELRTVRSDISLRSIPIVEQESVNQAIDSPAAKRAVHSNKTGTSLPQVPRSSKLRETEGNIAPLTFPDALMTI